MDPQHPDPSLETLRTTTVAESAIQEETHPHVFRVTLIQAGPSRNGFTYPPEALREAVPLFEGATAFVDHAGAEDLRRGTRSVRDVAGAHGGVFWDPQSAAIVGDLHVIHEETARLLAAYVQARSAGAPVPNIGISADLTVAHRAGVVHRIVQVHSADVVFGPAAGGAIHHVLHAESPSPLQPPEEDPDMKDPTAFPPTQPQEAPFPDVEGIQRAVVQDLLRTRLALAHDLPPAARDEVRRQFEGRVFAPEDLDQALIHMRRLVAELAPHPVQGLGPSVQVTMTPLDRIQLAADRLFGVPGTPDNAPRLTGVRELYITLTGDTGLTGRFNPEGVRISEAEVTTTTFPNVVKNALNKVLLAAYNVRPKWWQPIVWEEDFQSLNTVTWVKTGGIGDLPTVAEGDAYTELAWSDAAETASFVKKGGYIGITLEAIDRDDVAALRRAPRELGNAAWRTLSGLVSQIFTANSGTGPQMADGYSLFDATHHGNLRTAALSLDEWANVVTAMWEQQEPTSAKPLGVRPRFCLVPIELEKTALTLFGSPNAPGTGDNDINPYYRAATVITVPDWTDANDWAAVADPSDCPGICIGYRYGREPELFVADQPLVGSMFTNDEIRLKVRFYLAVGVADYRPLHKNNVA
ncbi:MAG: phage major capsid protein [Anaerolineae bacterium]